MFTTLATIPFTVHGITDTVKVNETKWCLSPGLRAYLAFLSGENRPIGPNQIEKYIGNVMDQIKEDYTLDFIKLTLQRFIENVPSHLKEIIRGLKDKLKII